MADVPRTADPYKAADLVVLNGTVRTMGRAGTGRTAPSARFGPGTRVLGLRGRCAAPGLIGTHNQPAFSGPALTTGQDQEAGRTAGPGAGAGR